ALPICFRSGFRWRSGSAGEERERGERGGGTVHGPSRTSRRSSLYPRRSPHKLAAAVRACIAHAFGASRAERAFVAADERVARTEIGRAAFLAGRAHLECHPAIFGESTIRVEDHAPTG